MLPVMHFLPTRNKIIEEKRKFSWKKVGKSGLLCYNNFINALQASFLLRGRTNPAFGRGVSVFWAEKS